MSKRTEIATTRVGPAYLQALTEQDKSLEGMGEYRVLPRIKVVQALTKKELRDQFPVGHVLLSPVNQLLATPGNPFLFVPAYFYVEYVSWNDRRDKSAPAIHARSFDKGGEIAHKAREASLRKEPYGAGFERRHTEQLTFPGMIYGDHPTSGTPCSLVFARGEFFTGKNFISSIMMRRIGTGTAPLWSQVWEFRSAERDRNGNQWWGLDAFAPKDVDPYIKEEEVELFKTLNAEFAQAFIAQKLTVDMSDADEQDLGQIEDLT